MVLQRSIEWPLPDELVVINCYETMHNYLRLIINNNKSDFCMVMIKIFKLMKKGLRTSFEEVGMALPEYFSAVYLSVLFNQLKVLIEYLVEEMANT